jgi:hypothetical protein
LAFGAQGIGPDNEIFVLSSSSGSDVATILVSSQSNVDINKDIALNSRRR